MPDTSSVEYYPLSRERWQDFTNLLGPQGGCGGCWCMYWRITRKQFSQHQGKGNQAAIQAIVDSGEVPGILAYAGTEPVGWIAVAPRSQYASLNRSRVLKPLDDHPVWSVTCFFIAKEHRGKGLMQGLLRAAIDYAASRGCDLLEAYPYVVKSAKAPPITSYMGVASVYARVGFQLCATPSPSKQVWRYRIP